MLQEAWRELEEPKASDLGVAGVIDASFATIEPRKKILAFGLHNPYPKDAVVPNTLSPRRIRWDARKHAAFVGFCVGLCPIRPASEEART